MSRGVKFPLEHRVLGVTEESRHFERLDLSKEVLLPICAHPGAFGAVRRFDIHNGVDMYTRNHQPVTAIESGKVLAIKKYTGAHSHPPTPWWNNTFAVCVEGEHGVLNYGELIPAHEIAVGSRVVEGQQIGLIERVLPKDKGRPQDMLHFSMYEAGHITSGSWELNMPQPTMLRDPTMLLSYAAVASDNYFARLDTHINLEQLKLLWYAALDGIDSLRTTTHVDLHNIFEMLLAQYEYAEGGQGRRVYHGMSHVWNMFKELAVAWDDIADLQSVILAVFFHDFIYLPQRRDNEHRSSTAARILLGGIGVPEKRIQRVCQLIALSKDHQLHDERDTDAAIFIGADLSILGKSEQEYRMYRDGVFAEYAPFYEREEISLKRKEFLNDFLSSRKKIFLYPRYAELFERQAQTNIGNEIRGKYDAAVNCLK